MRGARAGSAGGGGACVVGGGVAGAAGFVATGAAGFAGAMGAGFGGAALVVQPSGEVRGANDLGSDLLANFDEDTVHEIAIAGARAIAAGALRLERLNGPFPGDCADVVVQPLVGRAAGALVLIATNPAESALRRALIESRQRYRDLVEAASEFVWETDRHGRFVFLSGSGAFGFSTTASRFK